jgi:hypothetical protein
VVSPILFFVTELVLLVCAIYFLYMAAMILTRTHDLLRISFWDFVINICNFLVPGLLMVVHLIIEKSNDGFTGIYYSPTTTV